MLYADFAPKLARVLTEYSIPVQPGEYVVIEATTAALPLVQALYAAVLHCGGKPDVVLRVPELNEMLFALGNDEQLGFCAPTNTAYIEQADIMYYVFSEINTRARADVDPEKLGIRQKGWADWYATYHRRDGDESLRWNVCPWPTAGYAQDAEMSLFSYTQFVYRACGLDNDDPVAYWQALHARQALLIDWLAGKEHVQVKGPHIDLTLNLAGRTWENADG
ncbi:MAG: aminopeptidase, partial [Anaerolineae bacterium]|nr:aminopeptidase [Anaerolineae bacterium]